VCLHSQFENSVGIEVSLRGESVDQIRRDDFASDEVQKLEEFVAHEKSVRLHDHDLVALPKAIVNHAPQRVLNRV